VCDCCTASKHLTLAVSDLMTVQPQLAADSNVSQSKIHVRVSVSCRLQLAEYFQVLPPSDLETDDVGELLLVFIVIIGIVLCLSVSLCIVMLSQSLM